MKPLLLIKTGTAPAEVVARRGDFERWFIDGLDDPPSSIQVVRVDHDEQLRAPHHYRGAVVTGSAAMVSDRAPWSEQTGTVVGNRLARAPSHSWHMLRASAAGPRARWTRRPQPSRTADRNRSSRADMRGSHRSPSARSPVTTRRADHTRRGCARTPEWRAPAGQHGARPAARLHYRRALLGATISPRVRRRRLARLYRQSARSAGA
jgi:hypothetical protein